MQQICVEVILEDWTEEDRRKVVEKIRSLLSPTFPGVQINVALVRAAK